MLLYVNSGAKFLHKKLEAFGVGFFREWDAERRLKLARQALPNRPVLAVEERRRRKLVRRSHFLTIIAAWLVTVPSAAILSSLIFWAMVSVSSQ